MSSLAPFPLNFFRDRLVREIPLRCDVLQFIGSYPAVIYRRPFGSEEGVGRRGEPTLATGSHTNVSTPEGHLGRATLANRSPRLSPVSVSCRCLWCPSAVGPRTFPGYGADPKCRPFRRGGLALSCRRVETRRPPRPPRSGRCERPPGGRDRGRTRSAHLPTPGARGGSRIEKRKSTQKTTSRSRSDFTFQKVVGTVRIAKAGGTDDTTR